MKKINTYSTEKLLSVAFILSLITIFYNIVEGIVSIFFGYSDEALSLFGFGIDSFVEVLSGIGIAHMVWRMRRSEVSSRDSFERFALKITGISFYILTIGLIAGALVNIINHKQPEATLPGIIIAIISIITMWFLYSFKLNIGKQLNSLPIIADANCTKTCFYLSFILLGSSLLYELFKIQYIDIAGSIGIAWFAYREGKEAFEKAESNSLSCSCNDCCDK
jgi:divalent metal cation (Fe/Co/Zn/Cd) transporter